MRPAWNEEIYSRTPFKAAQKKCLRESNVCLLALGSLGSSIALGMARAGVGNFILCDPAKLKIENVSRHEGDTQDVGEFKAVIVKQKIARINPGIRVVCKNEDIFTNNDKVIRQVFEDTSLTVASTDKTSAQLICNYWTYTLKIPALFAGCYEEARAGEVFFTIPGSGSACYGCLRDGLVQPYDNKKIDYSTARNAEDYVGEPGLHAAVTMISSIATQIAMGILLRDENSGLGKLINPRENWAMIGTGLSKDFYKFKKPFEVFFQRLKGPRRNCYTCKGGGV